MNEMNVHINTALVMIDRALDGIEEELDESNKRLGFVKDIIVVREELLQLLEQDIKLAKGEWYE